MKDKIVTLVLCLIVLAFCLLAALLGAKIANKYFAKPAAAISIQTNSPPTEYIVWMTNFSLLFSKDGKEIIYKPETEVGFKNDGTVVLRMKEKK